jgi:DNA-binding response OmpR family regulator
MKPPTVLVVEDDRVIADLYRTLFRLEGFEPLIASSNADAVGYLRASRPDVIVLDIMMPGGSGLDLCRAVRQSSSLADIPVIVVSAKTQEQDIQAGLQAGANAYLKKPVSNHVLLDTVRHHLVLPGQDAHLQNATAGLEREVQLCKIEVQRYVAEIDRSQRAYQMYVRELEQSEGVPLAEKQANARKAGEMYRRLIRENETAGWEILEKVLNRLELRDMALQRRRGQEPVGREEWQTAAAQAKFVKEDCQRWAGSHPPQVVEEYRLAVEERNRVRAFLLDRYGQEALEEANELAALEALRSEIILAGQPDPEKMDEVGKLFEQIEPLKAKLSGVRLPDTLLLVERAPKNGRSHFEAQGDDTLSDSPRPSLRELLAKVKANGNGKGGLQGEAREDRREERASSLKP